LFPSIRNKKQRKKGATFPVIGISKVWPVSITPKEAIRLKSLERDKPFVRKDVLEGLWSGSTSIGEKVKVSSICEKGSRVPSGGSMAISVKVRSDSTSSVLESTEHENDEGCGPVLTRTAVKLRSWPK
jgi:hypothetical protein